MFVCQHQFHGNAIACFLCGNAVHSLDQIQQDCKSCTQFHRRTLAGWSFWASSVAISVVSGSPGMLFLLDSILILYIEHTTFSRMADGKAKRVRFSVSFGSF